MAVQTGFAEVCRTHSNIPQPTFVFSVYTTPLYKSLMPVTLTVGGGASDNTDHRSHFPPTAMGGSTFLLPPQPFGPWGGSFDPPKPSPPIWGGSTFRSPPSTSLMGGKQNVLPLHGFSHGGEVEKTTPPPSSGGAQKFPQFAVGGKCPKSL